MGIFKRAHVRGMTHELVRQGVVSFRTKFAEEEVADAVADNMEESEMPEVTGDEGLSPEQAKMVLDQIVDVAETINANTQGEEVSPEEEELNKMSSYFSYDEAAMASTYTLMAKVAEETAVATGPIVPGDAMPKPELGATAEAEIDALRTPSASLVGPMGTSALSTSGGEVGEQTRREDQPGAQVSEPDNEVAKLAALLSRLGKAASVMDGPSLSGGATQGPAPTPVQHIPDNLNIPGAVASSQGHSAQNVPASAVIGAQVTHPGGQPGPTPPVNNTITEDVGTKQAMEYLMSTPAGLERLRKVAAAFNV